MVTASFAALETGQVFISSGRTLTEIDHGLHMMLVADWHPIHADEEYARTGSFGRRVMHGSFGIGLALGMQANLVEYTDPVIGALGLREWMFLRPLFIGDTVHVEMHILGKRVTQKGDRGIVERRLKLLDGDGSVVQEGLCDIMLQLR